MPKDKIDTTDNESAFSAPSTALHIAVKRLDLFTNTFEPNATAIEPDPDDRLLIDEGTPVIFELTNRAAAALYIALFNTDESGSSRQLYPEGNQPIEPVAPARTISLGQTRQRSRQLRPLLPPDQSTTTEQLVAIATPNKELFEKLLQEQTAHRENAEFYTAQMQITIRSAPQRPVAQPLQSGAPTALPASYLRMEAPLGYNGTVRLLEPARSRAGKNAASTAPASLSTLPTNAQPLELAATRAAGPATNGIEIELDVEAAQAVSAETPLKLYLPNEPASIGQGHMDGLFAIAFDGALCHLVGRSSQQPVQAGTGSMLQLDWLPEPGVQSAAPDAAQPQQRGAGRTLKLYLYKLRDWQEPTVGLHAVSVTPNQPGDGHDAFALDSPLPSAKASASRLPAHNQDWPPQYVREAHNHQVHYRKTSRNRFEAGQRIAIIVHGFTSETTPSVAQILPMCAKYGVHYDHFLAFDYETYGTAISENGRLFAETLREAGFAPDDGLHVDIFAHSMGTLVTRCMIEQWGGTEFVDRCFLCGPPNLGTRLAAIGQLTSWLSTMMLNFSPLFPPAFLAGWVLGKVALDGAGSRDLHPQSDFLAGLNSSQKRPTVPYYVLAGSHRPATDEPQLWQLQRSFEQRLGTGLDKLFADQNDLVINVQSMLGVRNGNYPTDLLQTKVVQCNHFGYFATDECQGRLAQWLKGN